MANDLCILEGRISSSQDPDKLCESLVLNVLIRRVVGTFKLYTNREIIAFVTVTVTGLTRMPSSLPERNVLRRLALARDHYVT